MPDNITFIYPWAGHPEYRQILQGFGSVANTAEPPYPDNAQTELWKSTNGAQGTAPAILNYHRGVDFAVPSGTPILAAADGVVEHAGWDTTGYGNMVGIKHTGTQYATLYAHNASIQVSVGQTVTQGQQISVSDSTGNSSGPHLHFGVNVLGSVSNDNGWTDPMQVLGDAAVQTPQPYTDTGTTVVNATAPGYVTLAQAVALARQVGIPEDQVATAAAIADAESSLQINAVSPPASDGTVGQGLWQIESSHTQYDAKKLTSDPFYNAQAMYDIWHNAPNGGDNWTPWTTYGYVGNPPRFVGWGNGAYKTYLNEAQTAQQTTPLGSWPQDTTDGTAPIQVDTTPELPVDQVIIQPVTINPAQLTRTPGTLPTAALRINGAIIPVSTCQFTAPQYRTAGSWQATVPASVFNTTAGITALNALFKREMTQVTVMMGYVTPGRDGKPDPRKAADQFTGLAYIPEIDDSTGMVTLNGPDLSGVFSMQSATASKLQSFMNMPADKAIKTIVSRHNPPSTKGQGLSVDIDVTAGNVGGIFGADAVSTRTPVRTEWDVILQIADGEGMVAYFSGTTLMVKRVPDVSTEKPLIIYHRMPGKRSPLVNPRFRPQPHSKRDYVVNVYSYDTRQGKVRQASAGNTDSPESVDIYLAPNRTQDQLKKKAQSVLAVYTAMEYQADLSFVEPIQIAPTQPVAVVSGSSWKIYDYVAGRDHPFYVVTSTTKYDPAHGGITIEAQCSNRQPAIQDKNSASNSSV